MAGLIVKLILYPLILYAAAMIFPQLHYAHFYQPVLAGFLLAAAAHIMELYILKKGTLYLSALADFIAGAVIIYFLTKLLPGAGVTWMGAFLAAFMLAIVEILLHYWLLSTGKTK